MAYKSLAQKSEPMLDAPMEQYYPCIYVDDKQMAEIAKKEVGDEFELKIKVRVKSTNSYSNIKVSRSEATLEMLAYEIVKK